MFPILQMWGDKMLNLPKGGEETFTLAFNELNKIIKEIKESQK